jgi:hypothetical protein
MVTKIDNQFIDPNYEQIITSSSFNSSTFNLTSFNLTTSLKKNKYEIASFVSSLNKMSHPPIVFLNQRENSFLKDLIQILHEDYDATSIYFSAVNEDLYDFSESSKSYCLTTIESMKQHGGFSFKDEKVDKEKEKEREERERGEKEKTDKKEVVKNKGGAFLFAAAAAFVTGDIITPVSVFLDDELAERNNSYKDLTKVLTKDLDLDLVFDYSQIYCINTFSLFFAFKSKEQSLTIYGDKINYEYFVNFFNGLQENIKTKNLSSVFMENIIEQLEVLKMVASKLEQLVVFELHDKLTSLIKEGSSVSKIQKYISKKVSELVDLKQIFVKDFPILKANYKEEARLNAVKREINALKHADTLLNARQDSDQKVTKDVLQNELNGNEFEAFALLHVYGPLKRTTKLITRAIIVLPEGVAVGGLQGIYDFLGSICNIFTSSPVTTGVIIIGGLAVIYSSISTIACSIFHFVSWIFFPFFKGTKVPL